VPDRRYVDGRILLLAAGHTGSESNKGQIFWMNYASPGATNRITNNTSPKAKDTVTAAGIPGLSVIIITLNEESNLARCVASLNGVNCEIVVVDSGSTDRTKEIASAAGARVVEHAFETHTQQWLWALDNLQLKSDWVFGMDADQRLSPELRHEINELFCREELSVRSDAREREDDKLKRINGFYVKRRQVFRGKWIRHGGYYPKYLLKLFRRDKVKIETTDLMDHHFYVDNPIGKLQHDLIEDNKKENDISFWIDKHNRYASLLAREELLRNGNSSAQGLEPSLIGNPDQRTLWLKRVWTRLPLYVRPFLYFFYRYFLRLGFLDGKQGFIFHFLQGFWFRLLVDIKIDELRREQRSEVGSQHSEVGDQRSADGR
jgi:glycosyltransferase involved in cell wall biosynthesis